MNQKDAEEKINDSDQNTSTPSDTKEFVATMFALLVIFVVVAFNASSKNNGGECTSTPKTRSSQGPRYRRKYYHQQKSC